jgi:phage replication-related protein YjqB (UPF0714/DUF867 family)
MPDRYRSYAELARTEREGDDYRLVLQPRLSPVMVIAPHGGGIEPGTSELAQALAGEHRSLYCFEGLRTTGSARLHITSTRFDEPGCLQMLQQAHTAVALHGCDDVLPVVYVGGLHEPAAAHLCQQLVQAGFPACRDTTHHAGIDPTNLCNRGQSGKGVQLEISRGLRQQFFAGLTRPQRQRVTPMFESFIATLSRALLDEAFIQ